MWFIPPVGDRAAEGLLRDLYDQDLKEDGYISNTTRAWSYRPGVATQWQQLVRTIHTHLRLRAYELVTLAVSRAIGCVF